MADNNGNGFLWFLAGLGLGALGGVLYAPRSGSETREMLRSRAEEGSEQLRQQARRVRDNAGEWIDRGKETVTQHREKVRAAVEAGRQAYYDKTSEAGPQNL